LADFLIVEYKMHACKACLIDSHLHISGVLPLKQEAVKSIELIIAVGHQFDDNLRGYVENVSQYFDLL